MKKIALLTAFSFASAFSQTAFAADDLSHEHQANLTRSSLPAKQASAYYKRSKLAQGKTATHTVRLTKGANYRIYGDCDDNCSDLNLGLFANGEVIDKDYGDDDIPMLNITPSKTQTYAVHATMAACTTKSGCAYHVDVVNLGKAEAEEFSEDPDTLSPDEYLKQQRTSNLISASNSSEGEVVYDRSTLATGESKTLSVPLKADKKYRFYADCAPIQCDNIDLKLSQNGKTIEEDTSDDVFPLFTQAIKQDGTYEVEAKMVQCKEDKCEYHIHVIEDLSN
ncbi:hypothetical protein [Kingella negevensis]|uniref:Uncharacterized protein n=1 Tax=Kingella negevensis TaxID=1522312 RepID=A0A238HE14_9NEIS|nr:hypothetical protein [Kingella negevensis]MDK4683842.1 hypothetical protein [Kingella negevensis]MDK4688395.1 hypothetical protein [Kingella negevensis]MDK4697155.1 hypothetical protein [Kingella negevensis]MDK4708342.1 hypothetical protein [Kingella negevensis]MDK4709178.1 hypothetical protein [Kingella negevensis]